ncbi:hypothetical protein COO60DRAFT_1688007 [Scenedesmus sp. NREL 46B-D3]|nr:hypothetical protein COO60DRAFT_1688007 [Scenedesmus sp. NREL 46B-D3]
MEQQSVAAEHPQGVEQPGTGLGRVLEQQHGLMQRLASAALLAQQLEQGALAPQQHQQHGPLGTAAPGGSKCTIKQLLQQRITLSRDVDMHEEAAVAAAEERQHAAPPAPDESCKQQQQQQQQQAGPAAAGSADVDMQEAGAAAGADEAAADAAAMLAGPAAAAMQRTLGMAPAVLRGVPAMWELRMQAAVQARAAAPDHVTFGPPPPLPYTAALNAAVVHHCLGMSMGRGSRATLKLKELLFELLPVSADQRLTAGAGLAARKQQQQQQQQQRGVRAGLQAQPPGSKQQQQQHKATTAQKVQQSAAALKKQKGQLAGTKRPAPAAGAAAPSAASSSSSGPGPPAKMRKQQQQQGQQQRLLGKKAAPAGAGSAAVAAAAGAGAVGGGAKPAAAPAPAAAAAGGVPDTLGAGGLKAPKAYHDAAFAAAAHAGASPGLLQQVSALQLRAWAKEKVQQCTAAAELLKQLEKEEGFRCFLHPVDVHKLPEYAQEVAHPMCFDWIRQALQGGKYKVELQQQQQQQQQRPPLRVYSWQSLYAFAHDVQLIVSNARLYNGSRPQNKAVLEAAHSLQVKAVLGWSKVQANMSNKMKQRLEAHRQQQQQHHKQ